MLNKTKWGVASLALIFIAIALPVELTSGFCLGDFLLKKVGLKVWSNGDMGIHYTFFYSLILILIGWIGCTITFNRVCPKISNNMFPIILVSLFIVPCFVNIAEDIALSFIGGIKSIEYNYKTSICQYESNSENSTISVNYYIELKNHSKEKINFYMKVESPDYLDNKNMIIVNDEDNKIKLFTIHPKERKGLNFSFKINNTKNYNRGGTINGPKVIIFNEKEENIFLKSRE